MNLCVRVITGHSEQANVYLILEDQDVMCSSTVFRRAARRLQVHLPYEALRLGVTATLNMPCSVPTLSIVRVLTTE
jgi:hypothetical protein